MAWTSIPLASTSSVVASSLRPFRYSFTKMQKAIADKAFDKEVDGIPVLKYEAVNHCEVQNPGLGPLHTNSMARATPTPRCSSRPRS
ncbi:MAG: hypothetical protein U0163_04080 [Gemmatimonadaceae bacterium]